MDFPAGKRMMTTLRKLPMTRPKTKKKGAGMLAAELGSILGNVPHAMRGLNDGARVSFVRERSGGSRKGSIEGLGAGACYINSPMLNELTSEMRSRLPSEQILDERC